MNQRTRIKNEDVKVLHVPHFHGLTLETMLGYASQSIEVMRCLPAIEREINKLPRAYIANVIYTIIGESFKEWVNTQITMRNDKIKNEKDVTIEMDPEIAAIFRAS